LQSFSDDFVFEGSFTQASSQIGNAVPPLAMASFAPEIQKHLGYGNSASDAAD
jgi:site-specific DNA-cytosine methylase